MVDRRPAPPITEELIEWLRATYPHRIPHPATDEIQQVWFDAGIQHVVQRLDSKRAKQDAEK